ncbi:MAG: VWA domain-containing protein [Bacteroidetes bacterium]|jgi:Ca-activated chloride channel family protein|nr:VWA domain-containing protein [Bacteroidota bacterium]MDF1863236.1 VWA domain-containing protein [Saprospiraceae bacterium]
MFDSLQNITFVNPEAFFLLLLLPIIGAWYFFRRDSHFASLKMSSLESIQNISSWRGKFRVTLPIFRAIAFLMLVTALARPQETLKEEDIKAEGIDIFLVMDLSSSMLAQDFKPDRLEVSKRVAGEFVDKREFDRIGLSVFAGEAFTQCPLTTDHRILKDFLSGLKCGILDDGTAIGMGLATAVNRVKDTEAKSKVVILLTDGVNNAGYVKPITAAEIAREFDVKVYTIGVGSTGDALTPVSRRRDGRYIFGLARVEIDEGLLKQIAEMTGGKYFRATSAESLERIYAEIDRLEKTEIDITSIKRYSEEFHRFALLGLIFLVIEIILRYTVFRTIP